MTMYSPEEYQKLVSFFGGNELSTIKILDHKDWVVVSNPYVSGSVPYVEIKTINQTKDNITSFQKGGDIIRNNETVPIKDYGFFQLKMTKDITAPVESPCHGNKFLNLSYRLYGEQPILKLKAYAHIDKVGFFEKTSKPFDIKFGVNERGLFVESCSFK